ncbi:MAG: CHAT domain-containing protein, partial [Nitrospinaceae bacterium]
EAAARARRGRIQQSIRKGRWEQRGGEGKLARKTFLKLIGFSPETVEAHRGYVQAEAALGQAAQAVRFYQGRVEGPSPRHENAYALGLAYTYLEPPDLDRARQWIGRALLQNGDIVFYHQTLGWIYEQMERAAPRAGYLERAAQEYETALALNDPVKDPQNQADLLLNLGNGQYALNNFFSAALYYARRLKTGGEFGNPRQELLFYRRFGESVFKTGQPAKAVELYGLALHKAAALNMPARQAELNDRLGLAYQDLGKHAPAVRYFSEALDLNRKMGNTASMARTLRNIANNLYALHQNRQAGDAASLNRALGYYFEALENLDRYGTGGGKKAKKGGGALLDVSVETGLGDDASAAAQGFDKQGEQKLIFHYVGKIAGEFGDFPLAIQYFQKKLELIPPDLDPEKQIPLLLEKALLLNQIGHLYFRQGGLEACKPFFRESYTLSKAINNRQGMGVNASNLGRVLILQGRTRPLASLLPDLDSTLALLEEAAAFLDAGAATLPNSGRRASLKNSLGILYHYRAYFFEEPLSTEKDPVRAVQASMARLGQSSAMALKSLQSFEEALEAARDLPPEKRGKVTAALRLNLRLSRHLAGREIPVRDLSAPAAAASQPRPPLFAAWQLDFLDSLEAAGKPRLRLLLAAHEALAGMPFAAPRGPARLAMIEDLYQQLAAAFFDAGKWDRALYFSETGLQQALASLWGRTDLTFEDSSRRELVQEMRNFAREFLDLMENSQEDSARREETGNLLEEYRVFLEDVVAVEDPGLMAMVSGRAPSMEDVRERLPADAALVKFDWTGDRVLVWTLFKDKLRGQSLAPGKDLRRRILRLSRDGEPPRPEDVEVLSRQLWAPVAPEVEKASSLILIAGGPLEFLPWAALRFEGKPLIETAALSLQSSLTQFVLAAREKNLYNVRLLAVEWPAADFKAQAPRFASAENLTGEAAVGSRFLQEFGSFGAVAVDSPAYLSGWDLEDSYLSLSRRKNRYERVFLPGWMGRRVEANFLALTHVGHRFSPQHFFSPTAPLLHGLTIMGYPGILLHSGAADPEKHGPFMDRFFSTFRQGNPAASLRQAQLEWLRREPGSVDWAAYRYYGFPGMTAAEKSAFAASRYQENVQAGAQAFQSKQWAEAVNRFEKALALVDFLQDPAETSQILRLLAQAAYNRSDYKKGVHYQKRVLALAQAAEDPEQSAEAHYFLGILYSRDENFAAAVTHLNQALAFYEEYEILDKLAESYSTLGIVEENALDYDGALQAFQASIKLNEELGEDLNRGRELRRLGRIHLLRLNDFSRAEALFEEANRLFQELGVPEQVAETWLEMGQAAEKQSRFDEALRRYGKALSLAQAAGLDLQVAKALLFQGNTNWFRGDYQSAFRFLNQALKIAGSIGHTHQQILIENSLGLVYWTLNDSDRALTHLEKSRAMAESTGADLDAASAYNNMGLVHRKDGRLEKSITLFQEALRRDVQLKSKWGQGYTHRNLGISYLRLNKLDLAEKHIRSAITLSSEIGNNTNLVKAQLELGHLALQRGQCGPAIGIFQETADLAERFQIKEVLWRAWRGQGACLEKTGRRAAAVKAYQQAVKIVDAMRAAIKVEEFQNGFLTDKQDVYKELILLLLESGRVKDAFEYAERAKARSFIDLLGNQKISLKDDVSQKLYDRLVKAKQDIRRTEERLAQTEGAAAVQAVRKELVQARNRYGDLLVEAKQESPQISNFISVDSITLDRLQALLEKEVALIEYLVTPRELVAWVVTRDGIDAVRTPLLEADLETKVRDIRRRMQTLAPLDKLSMELYDLLFRPLEPLIAGQRVLGIVPHGHLHYLSFASLHDGQAYLIERHPLFFAPSASVLEYTFSRQRPSGGPVRVLAMGNPDLGSLNYDLPLAELEAASIRWDFPQVTILTRERATESWLKEHIGEFQIIHIASHGEFDPVNPLFSSLKLTKDDKADGNFEVNEVFSLNIQADLVTLSACQTGLGKITGGDELVGLNRAFIYAGTHAIISSLWRVSDITTAVLIKHFFRNYVRQNKSESLRKAQLLVKRLYPHPAYWSGFALTGDYR